MAKIKTCGICQASFIPHSSLQKFCSYDCQKKHGKLIRYKPKPLSKVCKVCKKTFLPYTSLDKFCSSACRVDSVKMKRKYNHTEKTCTNRTGVSNPAYKHGLRMRGSVQDATGVRLYYKSKESLRSGIASEKGHLFCQRCEINKGPFETHHIIYRSEKPKHPKLHDKINLILLCVKCHNFYHNKKANRLPLIEERKLTEVFGPEILNKQ